MSPHNIMGGIDATAKADIHPGSARDLWRMRIRARGATDVQILENVIQPGGTFGWHSHPGIARAMDAVRCQLRFAGRSGLRWTGMFLLLTGASGAGKSTVRELIADELAAEVECVELGHIVSIPPVATMAWRQQATEAVVQWALALQAVDRHVLLAGDPVAPGEVIAAPSADKLDAVAVCLLDVNADAQAARLAQRGDDPRLLADHQAFASWMRAHAEDANHMPHVLSTNGWDAMRWDRLTALDPHGGGWGMHVLDTSGRTTDEVADDILIWCRQALRSQAPQLRVVDPERQSR